MKASELRIGNYLNGRKGPVTVTEIRENNRVKIKENPSNFTVGDCLLPIPLTEEWLLKLGFELEHEFTNAYKLYTTKHPYDCSNITYGINEKMLRFSNGQLKGATLIPHIKYIHQLQNLYFALTGEELTLEP